MIREWKDLNNEEQALVSDLSNDGSHQVADMMERLASANQVYSCPDISMDARIALADLITNWAILVLSQSNIPGAYEFPWQGGNTL